MRPVQTFSLPAVNRRVLLTERPVGIPERRHFCIDAQDIPVPKVGQILVRNLYLSVDPAQRGWASDVANYAPPVEIGEPMRALAVGQIVKSRAIGMAAGDLVYGWFGWQDYAAVGPDSVVVRIGEPSAPISAYAGPLGINGLTAFIALSLLGRPQPGETVLVSTAAGAVGSLVGQLARAAGCRVVGLAGGPEKVRRCVERYGYDAAIDYRAEGLEAALEGALPDGVDIYFDNVGGAILDQALRRMRVAGRIVQCGTASIAAWSPTPVGPRVEREILIRRLSWNGFVVFDHPARFTETIDVLAAMLRDGALVYDEDIDNGIEAAPGAIAGLYAGTNRGKKLIFVG